VLKLKAGQEPYVKDLKHIIPDQWGASLLYNSSLVRKSCASLLDGVYGAKIISIVLQVNIHANVLSENNFMEHSLSACASIFKPLPVTSIGGSVNEQILNQASPHSTRPLGKLPSIKPYRDTFSPFPEPDFPQGSIPPDHHLIGNTYATWGRTQLYDYFNDALGYS
jgi:hypothetical protein